MQQYMVQIIKNLEKKGYKKLNPDSNNVYGRVEDDAVYVVVIGSGRNLDVDSLKKFNDKLWLDLSFNSNRKVNILNILITSDGIFDDATKKIVDGMNNVWLFTEDYGKLYIFENQPADFDGLYDLIDKRMLTENEKTTHTLKNMFGVVTPVLVVINVLVYVIGVFIFETSGSYELEYKLAINVKAIADGGEYYRFITAMFTHFGIAHLFGNMVILIALGARVENIVGKINYLLMYIGTGLAAGLVSYIECYIHNSYDYAAGASGAIFGLLGVLVAIAVRNKGRVKDLTVFNMLLLMVLTVINGQFTEGIDNVAHIAGFVAGVIAGVVLILTNQKVVKTTRL